jgi:hypothetical protein
LKWEDYFKRKTFMIFSLKMMEEQYYELYIPSIFSNDRLNTIISTICIICGEKERRGEKKGRRREQS